MAIVRLVQVAVGLGLLAYGGERILPGLGCALAGAAMLADMVIGGSPKS